MNSRDHRPKAQVDSLRADVEEIVRKARLEGRLEDAKTALGWLAELPEADRGARPGFRWPTLGELVTGSIPPGEDLTLYGRKRVPLDGPEEVVPRFCYRGRYTLLAAAEKVGKSHLLSQVASAVTRGAPFLDGTAKRGRVLWLGLDENADDTQIRLELQRCHRDRVVLIAKEELARLGRDNPLALLHEFVTSEQGRPDLIVVDSLREYLRRMHDMPLASGDSAGHGALIRPLTELAHAYGPALLVIHHTVKSGEKYRDSSEIGASADVIVTMRDAGEFDLDETTRHFSTKGRLGSDRFTAVLNDADGQTSLEASLPGVPDLYTWHYTLRGAEERVREERQRDRRPRPNRGQKATFDALEGEMTSAEWRAGTRRSESTFHEHRRWLVEAGWVFMVGDRYSRSNPESGGDETL